MSVALLHTASPATDAQFEQLVAGLVPDRFASAVDVALAGGLLAESIGLVGRRYRASEPGQRYYLRVSGGTVALRTAQVRPMDESDGYDVDDVAVQLRQAKAGRLRELVLFEDEREDRAITEWSPASRRRMVRTLAELDYSAWMAGDGMLAMVTLTLPGWWQVLAPTGGAMKRLMEAFRLRWRHAIGPWRCLWKLEFHRRGAPHVHYLMKVPALVGGQRFEEWLSRTWADVCLDSLSDRDALAYIDLGEYDKHLSAGTGVDFSGTKYSDPRRTAIYFLKHSTKAQDDKEYQHVVPAIWQTKGAGPGRFWGYSGLRRVVAEVEIDYERFVQLRRVLRHVTRARSASTEAARRRGRGESVWTMGKSRRGGFGARGGGWVVVNDGLALAYDVGRAVAAP